MKNFVSQNIAIHPIAKADGLSGDGIVKEWWEYYQKKHA
jgi:hypothetical protein